MPCILYDRGGVIVVGPADERRADEIDIRRGSKYGNPFLFADERGRRRAIEAYGRLIATDAAPLSIARSFEPALEVHNTCAAMPSHVRLSALARLAERCRAGEQLVLRCGCKPRECHGDEIVKWVAKRVRP